MDDGLAEEELAAQAVGQIRPGDGVGRDAAPEHLALADEGVVDGQGDDLDGAKVLCHVGEADDVAQDTADRGVGEGEGLVVVRSQNVVVVCVEEGRDRAGAEGRERGGEVAAGLAAIVKALEIMSACTRIGTSLTRSGRIKDFWINRDARA